MNPTTTAKNVTNELTVAYPKNVLKRIRSRIKSGIKSKDQGATAVDENVTKKDMLAADGGLESPSTLTRQNII